MICLFEVPLAARIASWVRGVGVKVGRVGVAQAFLGQVIALAAADL
jgi:hypothetical protein